VRKHLAVIKTGPFEVLEAPHPSEVAGPAQKPSTEPSFMTVKK
jgi:hypothetical protein